MKEKPLDGDFDLLAQRLKELDGQIPVPFAATADGMKARLSAPSAAKSHPFGKTAWSVASLIVVAAIGLFSWPHLFGSSPLNNRSMGATFTADQSEGAVAADEFTLQKSQAETSPQIAPDASMPMTGGGPTEESAVNTNMRLATNYEEIQDILSAIPATQGYSAGVGAYPTDNNQVGWVSADLFDNGTYSYSLDSTDSGTNLTIVRNSDALTMSTTALSYTQATLLLYGDSLIISGQSGAGTQLGFYNVSNPSAPVLERTLTQQGNYWGTWFEDGALVIGSVYTVSDATALIPTVSDSLQGQPVALSAQNILLPDTCTQAVYAVVTAIPINPQASACSFAVLGGYDIRCGGGKVEIATSNTTAVLANQQGNLCYLSADPEKNN